MHGRSAARGMDDVGSEAFGLNAQKHTSPAISVDIMNHVGLLSRNDVFFLVHECRQRGGCGHASFLGLGVLLVHSTIFFGTLLRDEK